MPTYTTSEKVDIHLPDNVPTAISDLVDDDIADACNEVDALVGSRFGLNYKINTQKFPDITDNPATPALIEMCARYLAAAMQMDRIGDQVKEGKVSSATRLRNAAFKWLKDIMEGNANIYISGSEISSSNLAGVEDEIYENNDGEPVFNTDNLNSHLKH